MSQPSSAASHPATPSVAAARITTVATEQNSAAMPSGASISSAPIDSTAQQHSPQDPATQSPPEIVLQRIYGDEVSVGARILVDRLWPRGISKEIAHLDLWLRDVSPSNELRKWYDHDPAKTEEFNHRYHDELQDPVRAAAFAELEEAARSGPLTLLTGSKSVSISHAAYLRDLLIESLQHDVTQPPKD